MKNRSATILLFIFALFCTQATIAQKSCSSGEYWNLKSQSYNKCTSCPAGTFAYGSGIRTECETCPPGSRSYSGSSSCSKCSSGQYAQDNECKYCPSGTTSLEGSSSKDDCGICARGSYTTTSYSSDCERCPAGTYEVDRKSCKPCPEGLVSDSGFYQCVPCQAGSIAVSGTKCLKCPAGSYADKSVCKLCPAGTFAPVAANECATCPAGWTVPFTGATNCTTRCQPGSYAYKGLACFQCGAGTFGIDGMECRQCPVGTFSASGSLNCTQCQRGSIAVKGNSQCKDLNASEADDPAPTSMFTYVLFIGIIGAVVCGVVYLKNRKRGYEVQRDGNMNVSLVHQGEL